MRRRYGLALKLPRPAFGVGNALILPALAVLLCLGVQLALNTPAETSNLNIPLFVLTLSWHACLLAKCTKFVFRLSIHCTGRQT